MADFIVICVLLLVIGAAIIYIIREKKKGTKCIGCPAEGACCGKGKEGAQCSECPGCNRGRIKSGNKEKQ